MSDQQGQANGHWWPNGERCDPECDCTDCALNKVARWPRESGHLDPFVLVTERSRLRMERDAIDARIIEIERALDEIMEASSGK